MFNLHKVVLRLFLAGFLALSILGSVAYVFTPTQSEVVQAMVEPPDAVDGDEGAQFEDNSCEANGDEFSFFLCPALRISEQAVELFDQETRKAIQVNSDYYNPIENDAGSNTPLRDVWSGLRNIAFILLIPVMLMLVIGTALGFSFLDAYTVRRAMPRLLFAVVFITLSFDIGVILIEISNAAARGVQGLMVSAVGGPETVQLTNIFQPPMIGGVGGEIAEDALTGGLIVGGFIAFSVGALSIGIITSFLGSAALALLIIFAILLLRQLIIILILVTLPLAILTWIFPGNDKPWKLMWGTFTGLLWAGPAYAAFTILGRIAAYIVNVATEEANDGLINSVLIMGTKLFLIVGALVGGIVAIQRFAGAAGQLLGTVNDRSKGLFDRSKNYRAGQRKELKERGAAGDRYKRGPFKEARNRSAWISNNRGKAYANLGANPLNFSRRMKQNVRGGMNTTAFDESDKFADSSSGKAIFGDDAKGYASRATNREEIESRLADFDADRFAGDHNADAREQAVQQILEAQKDTGAQTFQIARIKAMAASGTGYQNDDGDFEADRFLQDINDTFGEDRNGAGRAIGQLKGVLKASGQLAGNAGFGTLAGQANNMWEAQNTVLRDNNGTALSEENQEQYRAQVGQTAHDAIMDDAAASTSAYEAAQIQKPSGAREIARADARRVQRANEELETRQGALAGYEAEVAAGIPSQHLVDNATRELAEAEDAYAATLAHASGRLDAMGTAAPAVQNVYQQELMSQQVGEREVTVAATREPVIDPGTGLQRINTVIHPDTGKTIEQPVYRTVEPAYQAPATVVDESLRYERDAGGEQARGGFRGGATSTKERRRVYGAMSEEEMRRRTGDGS